MTTATQKLASEHRPLSQIAREIARSWGKDVNYAAAPYLNAMMSLDQIDGMFYNDSAQSMVLYFLDNAKTWHGEDARRIKAELRAIVRSNGYPLK
jgi:hypothetical protein